MEENSVYDHWIKELQAEEKAHRKWRKKADKVVERYRDEEDREGSRFNILWSNTRVLHSAILSSRPKPDVTRRYKDPDQVSREIAEVTERALSYSVDVYDFDGHSDLTAKDYLLSGMGQLRVRYIPYFQEGEPPKVPLTPVEEITEDEVITNYYSGDEKVTPLFDELNQPYTFGQPEEELVYEEVTCENVPWKRFRWQPANNWGNVGWACIEHYLTKKEIDDQFGEGKSQECPMGYSEDGEKLEDEDGKSRALVHEIFDKENRKVIVICEGNKSPLKEEDDPWNLEGFYPFPKPMISNVLSDKLIPIPDYLMYQDQALELDRVTARINKLVEEIKYRGFYDGSFKDLAGIETLGDGEFIPVDDWAERFPSGRSLDEAVATMPIDELLKTLAALYDARDQIKQTIYEITGLSDIIRGSTKASETLGAQQLKQQNASLQLVEKQNEVARFFRDVFRIKAELLVEHFSPETLTLMTGVQVTPEMLQIMQNDLLRSYSIDIESDSTVASDQAQEQQNATELLTSITAYLGQMGPMIQMGFPLEVATEMLLFVVRRFRGGRQLEQALEKLNGANQGPAPIPQGVGVPPTPM